MLAFLLPVGDADSVIPLLDVLLHHYRVCAFGYHCPRHNAYTLTGVHNANEGLACPSGTHHPQW